MKVNWKLLFMGAVIIGLVVLSSVRYVQNLKQTVAISKLEAEKQTKIAENTTVRLAAQTALADLYRAHNKDLRDLNGRMVAALRIAIAERDTVIVVSELPTTTLPDSTRIANFRDSTFAGVIEGEVTAPPFPSPLGISYTLTRPAFTPEVAFVKVGDRYVASVRWQDEQVQINDVFFDAKEVANAPWLEARAESRYFVNKVFQANLMGVWSPSKQLEVVGGYGADVRNNDPVEFRAFVGVSKDFRIF